jgi:hypothetical protein
VKTNTILELWYENNKDWPIATLQEKIQLSQNANLTLNQVSNWLKQKRFKLAHKRNVTMYDCLSLEIKNILDKYFDDNPHPNYDETQNLKKITGIHEKKIKTYFRYRNSKKNILMNQVNIECECE